MLRSTLLAAALLLAPTLARADWTVPPLLRVPENASTLAVARASDHWMVLAARSFNGADSGAGYFARAVADDGTVSTADGTFVGSVTGPFSYASLFACGTATCLSTRGPAPVLVDHAGSLVTSLTSAGSVVGAVWNGSKYIVLSDVGSGSIHVATLDESGVLGPDHVLTNAVVTDIAWNGTEAAVVYVKTVDGPVEVRRIGADGTPIGSAIAYAPAAVNDHVAIAPRGTGWAVASQTSASTIDVSLHDAAWTKTKTLSFSGFRFDLAAVGMETWIVFDGTSLRSARIDATGALLDSTPNIVMSDPGTTWDPHLVAGGGGAIVLRDRRLALLGPDAAVAKAMPLTVPAPQTPPSIAAHSDGALLLWGEDDGTGSRLARVATLGDAGIGTPQTITGGGVLTTFGSGYLQVFSGAGAALQARTLSVDGTPSTPFTVYTPPGPALGTTAWLTASEGAGGAWVGWTTRTMDSFGKTWYAAHVARIAPDLSVSTPLDMGAFGSVACGTSVCWYTNSSYATPFDGAGTKPQLTIAGATAPTSVAAASSRFFVLRAEMPELTAQAFDASGASLAPSFHVAFAGRVGPVAVTPSGSGVLTYFEPLDSLHVVPFDAAGAVGGDTVLSAYVGGATVAAGTHLFVGWASTVPSIGISRLHVVALDVPSPPDGGTDADATSVDSGTDAAVDAALDGAVDGSSDAASGESGDAAAGTDASPDGADASPDGAEASGGSCAATPFRAAHATLTLAALLFAVAARAARSRK